MFMEYIGLIDSHYNQDDRMLSKHMLLGFCSLCRSHRLVVFVRGSTIHVPMQGDTFSLS